MYKYHLWGLIHLKKFLVRLIMWHIVHEILVKRNLRSEKQQKIWIENSLVLNNQYILNQTAGSGSVSISKNWHFYSSKRNPYTYKNHVQYLGIPLLYLFKPCLYKKCKYNVNLNSLRSNQYLYPHSCKSSIWSWKLLSIKTFLNFSYTDWEEDLPDQSIESERHQQTSEPLGNLIHCQLRCS